MGTVGPSTTTFCAGADRGHTDAHVAARLLISSKSVDHHVCAVLAKRGSSSRDRAAAEAVRLERVGAAAGTRT
jgi:hypothetical protein